MHIPAKRSRKIWKWILPLCLVLGLTMWWYFRPFNHVVPAMVLIPAGDFKMGDQSMPKIGNPDELPVHTVRVSAFYIGNCEVTKAEWDVVRVWGKCHGFTDLPEGGGKAPDHPVQRVSLYDVLKWCNARSLKEGLKPCYTFSGSVFQAGEYDWFDCDWSANGYRLPTEAEWEKAARGGKVGLNYPWGNTISHRQANFCGSSGKPSKLLELWNSLLDAVFSERCGSRIISGFHPVYATGSEPYTSPVGSFPANDYALHDMSGNVWEWCWGQYGGYPLDSYGVIRGGSWCDYANRCRVASRGCGYPSNSSNNFGFRIARSSVPQASPQ